MVSLILPGTIKHTCITPIKDTTSIHSMVEYFNHLLPLANHEQELVASQFHARLFRKRQFLLQEGDVCNRMYFVVRGCLRMYKIDRKGGIHILQFATENN